MDAGKAVEYDSPAVPLSDLESVFSGLVAKTGEETAEKGMQRLLIVRIYGGVAEGVELNRLKQGTSNMQMLCDSIHNTPTLSPSKDA